MESTMENIKIKIRASNLERRALCPASAREEAKYPQDTTSEAAERGTLLHKVMERAMLKLQAIDNPIEYKDFGDISPEDFEIIRGLCDELQESTGFMSGAQINFNETCYPNLIGLSSATADCVIRDKCFSCLSVIDFKFGSMPVTRPEDNLQLRAYALGIIKDERHPYKKIKLIIAQPEAKPQIKTFATTTGEIMMFEFRLLDIIEACQKSDAAYNPCEKACQFCNAKDNCPARVSALEAVLKPNNMTFSNYVGTLSSRELTQFYEKIKIAKSLAAKWFDEIEERVISGELSLDGYHVGDKPGNREWTDENAAYNALKAICEAKNIDLDKIVISKILSPSGAEKLFGKSRAVCTVIDSLVMFKPSKPAIMKDR